MKSSFDPEDGFQVSQITTFLRICENKKIYKPLTLTPLEKETCSPINFGYVLTGNIHQIKVAKFFLTKHILPNLWQSEAFVYSNAHTMIYWNFR